MSSPHPADSREAIMERLRLTREALGMAQIEWCRRTGIATNTWNNYERGVARISLDEAFKVVKATGVGLDWIYRGEEAMLPKRLLDGIEEVRKREKARENA